MLNRIFVSLQFYFSRLFPLALILILLSFQEAPSSTSYLYREPLGLVNLDSARRSKIEAKWPSEHPGLKARDCKLGQASHSAQTLGFENTRPLRAGFPARGEHPGLKARDCKLGRASHSAQTLGFENTRPLRAGFPARDDLIRERPVLVLYYTTYCPYSQKVLRYLQQIHKTLPLIDVENNLQAKQDLLKAGGKLQVPCLVVDGTAIYESDDIIQWLSKHQADLEIEGPVEKS